MAKVKQRSTLTSGTITALDTQQDIQIIQDGSILSAALTIQFPENPVDGQEFSIASGNGITTLTLTSLRTLIGGVSSLATGGFATWIYDAASNAWFRKG